MVLAEQDAKGVLQDVLVRVRVHVLEIVPDAVPRAEGAVHHAVEDVPAVVDAVIPVLHHVPAAVAVVVVVHAAAVPEIALPDAEAALRALVHVIQAVVAAEAVRVRAHPRVVILVEALALINVLVVLRIQLSNIFKEKEYEKNRNQN